MQRGNDRKDLKGSFSEVVIKRILAQRPNQAVVNSQAVLLIEQITNAQQLLQVLSLLDDAGKKDLLKKSKPPQWTHFQDEAVAKASLKTPLLNKSGAPFPNECLKHQDKYFIVLYSEFGALSHLYSNTQAIFLGNNKECIKNQYMIAPLMWVSTDPAIAEKIAANHIRITRDTEQMLQISRLISNPESRIEYVKNWGNFWIPKTEGKTQKIAVLGAYLSALIAALRGDFLAQKQNNTADILAELNVALEIYGSLIETKEDMIAIQAAVEALAGAGKLVYDYCKRRIDLPEEKQVEPKRKPLDSNDIRLRRSFELRCYEGPQEEFARCRK